MTKQTVDIGSAGNDHTGDPLRTAFGKVNDNFDELYSLLPVFTATSLQALSAGDPINLLASGSPPQLVMQKADAADSSKPADGFVIRDFGVDDEGEFYQLGLPLIQPDSPPPFTTGSRYYVAVGGGLTTIMPATTLNGQQEVGIAISDTELMTYLKPMNEAP